MQLAGQSHAQLPLHLPKDLPKVPLDVAATGPKVIEMGARIAEQRVDMLVFFWDPFEQQPHDPDIKALLRVAAVWNIPVACNESSADYMLGSALLDQAHDYRVPDYQTYLDNRQ